MSNIEMVAGIISFLFTVLVLSYLLGDNPLFRLTIYIFVGVSAGYAAVIAWYQVLQPKLFEPLLAGPGFGVRILAFVPFVLGILMLAKLSPRTARLGNPSMAFLVGVGAAVAVGGAVTGTLLPQIQASVNMFDLQESTSIGEQLFMGSIILVGTLTTLIYFHFGAKATPGGPRRSKLVNALGLIGQVFVAITLGVLFAGAYAAAMTALVDRLVFIGNFLSSLF